MMLQRLATGATGVEQARYRRRSTRGSEALARACAIYIHEGEIAKRILQLPKSYSNTAAIVALGWNSLHSVCTIRKLKFLHRVMTNEESICHRAFSAMVDDVETLSLVRECRELEERYIQVEFYISDTECQGA